MGISKNHQTAVFVLVETVQENFKERVERLVSGLNRKGEGPGSSIKADIFSVTDAGQVFQGYEATGEQVDAVNVASLMAFAHEREYVLAVVLG